MCIYIYILYRQNCIVANIHLCVVVFFFVHQPNFPMQFQEGTQLLHLAHDFQRNALLMHSIITCIHKDEDKYYSELS